MKETDARQAEWARLLVDAHAEILELARRITRLELEVSVLKGERDERTD